MTTQIVAMLITGFLAGPIVQQNVQQEKCLFPGNCLRHAFDTIQTLGFGKCASRSAWREQYIQATPEQRVNMWKARSQTMESRILQAYQLSEPQKKIVRGVIDDSYSAQRKVMGEAFTEMVNLRRATRQRLKEYNDEIQRRQDGGDPADSKVPLNGDDPLWSSIMERKQQIRKKYPFPWDTLLDTIDQVLPGGQAQEGRELLAEQYPHGFSQHSHRKTAIAKLRDGGSQAKLDRWEAYLERFTTRHKLTGGQANSSLSILREVKGRAANLTERMESEIARSSTDEGNENRMAVTQAFQFDLDDLFDEFKSRLDALLTSVQLNE